MANFLQDIKNFHEGVNGVARDILDRQITCMLLYHAGCMKIERGDVRNGQVIIDTVRKMIETTNELQQKCERSLSKEELKSASTRIGRDKIVYSSLSDAVLKSNVGNFDFAPRPHGDAYICDEALCEKNMSVLLQKYFIPV